MLRFVGWAARLNGASKAAAAAGASARVAASPPGGRLAARGEAPEPSERRRSPRQPEREWRDGERVLVADLPRYRCGKPIPEGRELDKHGRLVPLLDATGRPIKRGPRPSVRVAGTLSGDE
jgi:hypothetical protein